MVAPDGETRLYLATQFKPDVIFLDIALPGMDGLGLLDKVRAEDSPRVTFSTVPFVPAQSIWADP